LFSGIVSRVGVVERLAPSPQGLGLSIRADFAPDPEPGASIAVNGVCLTVEKAESGFFQATAVAETVARTTLGTLAPGDRVNLERALRVGDELGGHLVQGHVDGVGIVISVEHSGDDLRVSIEVPEVARRFVAVKGSVAVDGMSLTVAAWRNPVLVVALVPYTIAHTIASSYRAGTRVNLEADLIARYLDRLASEGAHDAADSARPASDAGARAR